MIKNVNLDAQLVYAAMRGAFVPAAIGLGITANEAFDRAAWLKRQPTEYVAQVSDRVVEIENQASPSA
jgi:hypothetical protein